MSKDIFCVIKSVVNQYFNMDINPNEEMNLDSMSVVEVLFLLENELQIRFDITQIAIEEVNTINKLCTYIAGKYELGAMNRKIYDVVICLVQGYFGKELDPSADLGLDSMSVIEVLFLIENELEIRFDISNIKLQEINTIENIVRYIEENFQLGEHK